MIYDSRKKQLKAFVFILSMSYFPVENMINYNNDYKNIINNIKKIHIIQVIIKKYGLIDAF